MIKVIAINSNFLNIKIDLMKIYLMGNKKDFEATEICLTTLIEKLALTKKRFAIEYNGEIISKGNFPQTFLRDGDKLEIVRSCRWRIN